MNTRGGKAGAFALILLLIWQTGAFSCHGTSTGSLAETGELAGAGSSAEAGSVAGVRLSEGECVLLGADGEDNGGYLFTLLDSNSDGITGAGLLLYTDPLGLESSPQQFDAAWEGADSDHPDEDSQLDGYSLWTESDLYLALNGSAKSGNADPHGANVAAARRFYERLSAKADEWEALLPHTGGGSDGERVSLLSELEFEACRGEIGDGFWYTGEEALGFWLKTARPSYTNQVRYIYSGDIPPSLTADAYYAIARETRAVRPALRLDLRRVVFGAGSGTAADPYRELALRPPVTLTLHIEGWNPQTAAEAAVMEETAGENADGAAPGTALTAVSTTESGIGRCTQTIALEDIAAGVDFTLQVGKPNHILHRQYGICLMEDTELTIALPCGDVNGDGSIDLLDRQLLLSAKYFNQRAAETAPAGNSSEDDGRSADLPEAVGGEEIRLPKAVGGDEIGLPDLDGDGKVGLTDLYLLMLSENFGKRVRVR